MSNFLPSFARSTRTRPTLNHFSTKFSAQSCYTSSNGQCSPISFDHIEMNWLMRNSIRPMPQNLLKFMASHIWWVSLSKCYQIIHRFDSYIIWTRYCSTSIQILLHVTVQCDRCNCWSISLLKSVRNFIGRKTIAKLPRLTTDAPSPKLLH